MFDWLMIAYRHHMCELWGVFLALGIILNISYIKQEVRVNTSACEYTNLATAACVKNLDKGFSSWHTIATRAILTRRLDDAVFCTRLSKSDSSL
jgi:hypothetical protein